MKAKDSALMASNTDDWRTPSDLYDLIVNENNYLDCFPFNANYNEFDKIYYGKKLYANPPYSKNKYVVEWIENQLKANSEVLLLLPARTDTLYFHQLLELNPLIYFIKGRLKFNDCKQSAPFPPIFMKFSCQWLCKWIYPNITNCFDDLL